MKSARTSLAVVAAAMVGMSAPAIGASALLAPAAAQTTTVNVAPSGAIPANGNSLTIHKYDGDTTEGSRDDGLPKGADALNGHNPLEGVTFHLYKLDISGVDLTTNSGWQALQGIDMSALRQALFNGPEIVENIQTSPRDRGHPPSDGHPGRLRAEDGC